MKLRRMVAGLVATVGLLSLPAQSLASHLQNEMAVRTESPIVLVGGVYVDVPVSVTCPAEFPVPLTRVLMENLSVSVTQKAGRGFAAGFGAICTPTLLSEPPLGRHDLRRLAAHVHDRGLPGRDDATFPWRACCRVGISLDHGRHPLNLFSQDTSSVSTGLQRVSIRGSG